MSNTIYSVPVFHPNKVEKIYTPQDYHFNEECLGVLDKNIATYQECIDDNEEVEEMLKEALKTIKRQLDTIKLNNEVAAANIRIIEHYKEQIKDEMYEFEAKNRLEKSLIT